MGNFFTNLWNGVKNAGQTFASGVSNVVRGDAQALSNYILTPTYKSPSGFPGGTASNPYPGVNQVPVVPGGHAASFLAQNPAQQRNFKPLPGVNTANAQGGQNFQAPSNNQQTQQPLTGLAGYNQDQNNYLQNLSNTNPQAADNAMNNLGYSSGQQQNPYQGFMDMYNTSRQNYYNAIQPTVDRLNALYEAAAKANTPPAELTALQNQIQQQQLTLANSTPQQFYKDNPGLASAGISQGQLERTTAQSNLPIEQGLAAMMVARSATLNTFQQGQQAANANVQSAQNQLGLQNNLYQTGYYGGLPPQLAGDFLSKMLFPQYNTATDVYGQPVAYNQYNPSQSVPIGPSLFGGQGGQYNGQQMGAQGGNIPQRLNNPGAMRGPDGQFMQFSTPQEGFQAMMQDIRGKQTGNTQTGLNGQSTLAQFAATWAPASDGNNPQQYAQNLASQLGVGVNTPIGQIDTQKLAQAVAHNEGFYAGGKQSSLPQILSNYAQQGPNGSSYIISERIPSQQLGVVKTLAAQYGIPVLDTAEVSKVRSVDITKQNLDKMSQVVDKILQPGIFGRAIQGPMNSMSAWLQSNKDISAFGTWRDTAINAIQALAGGSGTGFRLNQSEIDTAVSNLPKITDNLETAKEKLRIMNNFLSNWQEQLIPGSTNGAVVSSNSNSTNSNDPLGIL